MADSEGKPDQAGEPQDVRTFAQKRADGEQPTLPPLTSDQAEIGAEAPLLPTATPERIEANRAAAVEAKTQLALSDITVTTPDNAIPPPTHPPTTTLPPTTRTYPESPTTYPPSPPPPTHPPAAGPPESVIID